METSANYVVQNEDYLTKFTLNDCERRHTGIYKIHAKNDSGSDEADLEIVVLGESLPLSICGYLVCVSNQCFVFILKLPTALSLFGKCNLVDNLLQPFL